MNIQTVTLFPVPNDLGSIYDFFFSCEQGNTHVTIPLIRDHFFAGNYGAAYHHVHRYWRWFLKRISDDTSPHVFKVDGIVNYPRAYFIDAHKPEHMQFFHHFVESMRAYDNREKRIRSRRETNQDDQPLPTQLSLEELSEEEDLLEEELAAESIDTRQEKIEEEDSDSGEQSGVPFSPDCNTSISHHSVSRAKPNEGQLRPNEEEKQLPPQTSRRLFWYISCAVATVVIGIIIAYIVISRHE